MTDDVPPGPRRPLPDDLQFRTAAAPGLEEDDLFAALLGLPGAGVLWGDGLPSRLGDVPPPGLPDVGWDEERERRRRHHETLRRWPSPPPEGGAGGGL